MTAQDIICSVVRGMPPMARDLALDLAGRLISQGPDGQELLHTVECYLRANGSTATAARALFVHRNTVGYRLACVRRATGVGVTSNTDRVAWTLALLALGRAAVLLPLESPAGEAASLLLGR